MNPVTSSIHVVGIVIVEWRLGSAGAFSFSRPVRTHPMRALPTLCTSLNHLQCSPAALVAASRCSLFVLQSRRTMHAANPIGVSSESERLMAGLQACCRQRTPHSSSRVYQSRGRSIAAVCASQRNSVRWLAKAKWQTGLIGTEFYAPREFSHALIHRAARAVSASTRENLTPDDLLHIMKEDLPVPLFERPAEHIVTCKELLSFKDKAKATAVRPEALRRTSL
eukprot:1194848-Prorocentrum_minimum.AAC.3